MKSPEKMSFPELVSAYAAPKRRASWVRMNFVSSADGAVTFGGRSGGLGGHTDQRIMRVLRTLADVVLVGAGTVRSEGYGGLGLDEQAVSWRRDHCLSDVPALAVVSNRLDLDPDAPVFSSASGPVLVVTHAGAPSEQRAALGEVAEIVICGEDRVDLAVAVNEFQDRELGHIACEGGPHLFGALLDSELVDEVCLSLSPRFVGGDAGRIVQGASEADRAFQLAHALPGDDGFVFLRYLR